MRKFIRDPSLVELFKTNFNQRLTQKELSQKFSISISSVKRIINELKLNDNELNKTKSELSQFSQDESFQSQEELNQSQEQTNLNQEEPNESQDESFQSQQEPIIDQDESVLSQQSQQAVQILNNSSSSLHNFLNNQPRKIIEQPIPEQKRFPMIERPQPIQQVAIEQVKFQPTNEEEQNQINNFIIKIRKMMSFFSKEECIYHLIGSSEAAQRTFANKLHTLSLEEVSLVHKKIQFELLFSRSNTFVQDTIEQTLRIGEKVAGVIGIDVVGVYDEMQADPEFQFYMNLLICDMSFVPSAKQIIFMKFVKNYYSRFSKGGSLLSSLLGGKNEKTEPSLTAEQLKQKFDLL